MKPLTLAISLLVLVFSGCSPHKIDKQVAPSVPTNNAYSLTELQDEQDATTQANSWWHSFKRPSLDALIEQAFQQNLDLAQALARIEQAQAFRKSTAATAYPELSFEVRADESRRGDSNRNSSQEVGAALTWEIDLFRRISAAAQADKLRAFAREEDMNALKLSLSAELANAYFGAVASHKNLQLLTEQLQMDNSLLELTKLRLETGVGTGVEILQQASRVAESESLIPLAEAQLRVFENRLDVLLGLAPDGVNRVDPFDNLHFATQLPQVGVPAELLLNRPDLRAAQAELIAADADIAAAIAERLPRLTLEGSHIYEEGSASSDPISLITGSFILPLLDWGHRRSMVKRNKAIYSEKMAHFTQLYLHAVEDVENTLYVEGRQRAYVTLLETRRQILQKTVEETEALYRQGVSDYLLVLSALQELRDTERDLVTEQLNLIKLRIQLHRALGGVVNKIIVQEE